MLLFQLPFFVNFLLFKGKADKNPWRANTLEWLAESPPPHGNFKTLPDVYRVLMSIVFQESSGHWPQNEKGLEQLRLCSIYAD